MQCTTKYTHLKPNYQLVFTYMPLFKLFLKCMSMFFLMLYYTTIHIDEVEYFFFLLLFIVVCDVFERRHTMSMLDHTQVCLDMYLSLMYWDFCSGLGFWSSFVLGSIWFACYALDVLVLSKYLKPVQLKVLIPLVIISAQYGWWSMVLQRKKSKTFEEMQLSRVLSCVLYSVVISLDCYMIKPMCAWYKERDLILPDHSRENLFWHGYILFMEHNVSVFLAVLDVCLMLFQYQYRNIGKQCDDGEEENGADGVQEVLITRNGEFMEKSAALGFMDVKPMNVITKQYHHQQQQQLLNMSGLIASQGLEKGFNVPKLTSKNTALSEEFEKALAESKKNDLNEDDDDVESVK